MQNLQTYQSHSHVNSCPLLLPVSLAVVGSIQHQQQPVMKVKAIINMYKSTMRRCFQVSLALLTRCLTFYHPARPTALSAAGYITQKYPPNSWLSHNVLANDHNIREHSTAALPSNHSLNQHSITGFTTNVNEHARSLQFKHHPVLQPRNLNVDPAFSAQPSSTGSITALYKPPVHVPEGTALMPTFASQLKPGVGETVNRSHVTPAAVVPPMVQISKLATPISTASVPDQLRACSTAVQPGIAETRPKAPLLKTSLYQWGLPKKVVQVKLTSCFSNLRPVLSCTHHSLCKVSLNNILYNSPLQCSRAIA